MRYQVEYFGRDGKVTSSSVLVAENLTALGELLDAPSCLWEISRPFALRGRAELDGYRGRRLVVRCTELPAEPGDSTAGPVTRGDVQRALGKRGLA